MFGLSKKSPVAEHEASGAIDRVYHEIKQSLRSTGVNLNFRTWAAYEGFLPLMWDAIRMNARTLAFEAAADQLRADAARAATRLGALDVPLATPLGESQAFHVRGALDLYHYVNPKLLLLTAAVSMALRGEEVGLNSKPSQTFPQVAPGAPATMAAMEMESDEPEEEQLQNLYRDIQETLSLRFINSDYRTLALWPDYLATAWRRLKPVVTSDAYRELADGIRDHARALARELPYPVPLNRQAVAEVVSVVEEVVEVTDSFEQLLPGLLINIAILELDWRSGVDLEKSPFPAEARQERRRGAS